MTATTASADVTDRSSEHPRRFTNIIRPRRTWPGSRATVGGLLVAIAAIGLFAAFQQAGSSPETLYVVAREPIAPGTVLTASALGAQRMDLPDAVADTSFTSSQESLVLGAVSTQVIGAGELVQISDIRTGSGQAELAPFEMSFRIESDRAVNGGLTAGEHVNVIATIGTGPDAPTQLILTDVLVLEVSRENDTALAGGRQVITVALQEEADSLAIAAAADKGTLTLVRANR